MTIDFPAWESRFGRDRAFKLLTLTLVTCLDVAMDADGSSREDIREFAEGFAAGLSHPPRPLTELEASLDATGAAVVLQLLAEIGGAP